MQLENQRTHAKSKFKDVYGLIETDLCLYFMIKGRAYYILPKDSIQGGTLEEVKKFLQRKCAKHFQYIALSK